MSNQEYAEKEIYLNDYINVILKRKKFILIIFFVTVITAVIICLRVPNVYEATAILMIAPPKIETSKTQSINIASYVDLSIAAHKELMKSSLIIGRILDSLGQADIQDSAFKMAQLSRKIHINEVKDTNIIYLRAIDGDSKEAKKIADIWAKEYLKYYKELMSVQIKDHSDFVIVQFESAKQKLESSEEQLKDFNNKYNSDLEQAELEIKKKKLNANKEELSLSEINLKTIEDNLAELKKAIAKQNRFVVISKTITDYPERNKNNGRNDFDKGKLMSEEINPIFLNLETRIVNREIRFNTLKKKVEYLRLDNDQTLKEINTLVEMINDKELKLVQINRQINIDRINFNKFALQFENAQIEKSIPLREVKLISFSLEPSYPVSSHKLQKIAVSAVLSLMFSIFIAFFLESREKYQNQK